MAKAKKIKQQKVETVVSTPLEQVREEREDELSESVGFPPTTLGAIPPPSIGAYQIDARHSIALANNKSSTLGDMTRLIS